MPTQRILAFTVILVAILAGTPRALAKEAWWEMQIGLEAPSLVPPAVQWAVLDKDPVPGFTARVKRMQSFYRGQIERAKNESSKNIARSSGMTVSWDLGFKEVTGDQLYLLTSAPGKSRGFSGFSSNGPDGKKWIVTKTVTIEGKPACWCLPVEVKTGQEVKVTLSEKNLFDLASAFQQAMGESGDAPQSASPAKTSPAEPAQKSTAPPAKPVAATPPAKPAAEKGTVAGEPLMLDIARFYNMQDNQKSVLEPFSGRKMIDGLPFHIEGQARLWGQTVAERNPKSTLPDSLSAIRIGRKFDELHLIHHAIWPDVEGQPVAYICLNYADGTKSIFAMRYGAEVRDWYFLPSYEKDLPTGPETKICWRREPVDYKAPVRLFKTRLVNPFPEKSVEAIDVVSARNLANYTLVAATVANRDPARKKTPVPTATEPLRKFDGKLEIEVVDDATGRPIKGALVEPGMEVQGEGVVGAPVFTSGTGKGTIPYPVKQTTGISVSVKKEGYLPARQAWNRDLPDAFTFRLSPAADAAAAKGPGKSLVGTLSDKLEQSDAKGKITWGDPAGLALYRQMVQTMRKADSLSYTSHYTIASEHHGRSYSHDCTYQAWLKKPNYFRVETQLKNGEKGGILVGDGSKLWIYWPQGRPAWGDEDEDKDPEAAKKARLTSYMTHRAPPGGHSIGHEVVYLGAGMSMPVIDPSTFHGYTDSLQPYLDGVKSLGTEKLGDEEFDKIEVSIMKHQRSWVLWLSKSDHLPRKLHEVVRVSFDLIITEEWSSVAMNAEMPATLFAWKPPDGWKQWKEPPIEKGLLKPGAEAPDFELASTDGKPIKLSDYRGQVVWLYVWRAG